MERANVLLQGRVSLRQRLRETFLEADPRSLGLLRISVASVLLVDLLRRWPAIPHWYTNQGLIPNHTLLWRPPQQHMFSLFFGASSELEARVGFVLCGLAFLALLVGYRTRLAHFLSLVGLVSLHTRTAFVEDGGDIVSHSLLLWTFFLPLGRRFSVDAVLASLRAKPEHTPAELAARVAPDEAPVHDLAVLVVLLQLGCIYYFNAVHKSGTTWREGSVVHHVLFQERMVQWPGELLRAHLPMWASRAMTWGTLALEWSAPVLLWSPFGRRWLRRAALVLLPAMHVGFAVPLSLGMFSPNMIAFFPLLLSRQDWEALTRWLRGRRPALRVFYDVDCGFCFQCARVLARLDWLGKLELLPNDDEARLPKGVDRALTERTIVVEDAASGRIWTRHHAFFVMSRVLPVVGLPGRLLVVPGISQLAGRGYDAIAQGRSRISAFLGMPACGVPWAKPVAHEAPAQRPLSAELRRWARHLDRAVLGFFVAAAVTQVIRDNRAVPRLLKQLPQPAVLAAAIEYTRTFQGWSMFAPDAPKDDGYVVVDAVTSDGRHVDPLNQVFSRHAALPVTRIPPRLGQSQHFDNYTARIKDSGNYHRALLEWIVRYPERTGNPADKIVSFEASYAEHVIPAWGQTTPTGFKLTKFLSGP